MSETTTPERLDERCSDSMCEGAGSYIMEARCTNCGWRGEVEITKGHDVIGVHMSAECPRCETHNIQTGAFVSEASHD